MGREKSRRSSAFIFVCKRSDAHLGASLRNGGSVSLRERALLLAARIGGMRKSGEESLSSSDVRACLDATKSRKLMLAFLLNYDACFSPP
jgi:hypothetical protein